MFRILKRGAADRPERRGLMAGLDRTHALAWFDPHAKILEVNANFATLFGGEQGSFTGMALDRLASPEWRDDLAAAFGKAVRGEAELVETGFRRKDGTPMWLAVT